MSYFSQKETLESATDQNLSHVHTWIYSYFIDERYAPKGWCKINDFIKWVHLTYLEKYITDTATAIQALRTHPHLKFDISDDESLVRLQETSLKRKEATIREKNGKKVEKIISNVRGPKRYCLCIGVDGGLVKKAAGDAKCLHDILLNQVFDFESVILLQNPTKQAIQDAIDDICQNLGPDDAVVIMYGGHGAQETIHGRLLTFLLPSNAKTYKNETKELNIDDFICVETDIIGKLASPKLILMLDCCRLKEGDGGWYESEIRSEHNAQILYSTLPGDCSYEWATLDHTPFTMALIVYLKVPGLDLASLFSCVHEFVVMLTKSEEVGHKQTPQWVLQIDMRGFQFYRSTIETTTSSSPTTNGLLKYVPDALVTTEQKDKLIAIDFDRRHPPASLSYSVTLSTAPFPICTATEPEEPPGEVGFQLCGTYRLASSEVSYVFGPADRKGHHIFPSELRAINRKATDAGIFLVEAHHDYDSDAFRQRNPHFDHWLNQKPGVTLTARELQLVEREIRELLVNCFAKIQRSDLRCHILEDILLACWENGSGHPLASRPLQGSRSDELPAVQVDRDTSSDSPSASHFPPSLSSPQPERTAIPEDVQQTSQAILAKVTYIVESYVTPTLALLKEGQEVLRNLDFWPFNRDAASGSIVTSFLLHCPRDISGKLSDIQAVLEKFGDVEGIKEVSSGHPLAQVPVECSWRVGIRSADYLQAKGPGVLTALLNVSHATLFRITAPSQDWPDMAKLDYVDPVSLWFCGSKGARQVIWESFSQGVYADSDVCAFEAFETTLWNAPTSLFHDITILRAMRVAIIHKDIDTFADICQHFPAIVKNPDPVSPSLGSVAEYLDDILMDSHEFWNAAQDELSRPALDCSDPVTPQEYYAMASPTHGKVLLMSMEAFPEGWLKANMPGGVREGLQEEMGMLFAQDRKRISTLFSKDLHFEVEELISPTAHAVHTKVAELSLADHSDYDCFYCIIITFGGYGDTLFASDGHKLYLKEHITSRFNEDICDSLADKPKIFMIQSPSLHSPSRCVDLDKALPDGNDFYLVYSTLPHDQSNLKGEGSDFIQGFCKVVEDRMASNTILELDALLYTTDYECRQLLQADGTQFPQMIQRVNQSQFKILLRESLTPFATEAALQLVPESPQSLPTTWSPPSDSHTLPNDTLPKDIIAYVGPEGHFSTIQQAIDHVCRQEGNGPRTVIVQPNTYHEALKINRSVTVKGITGNPDDVVVRTTKSNALLFTAEDRSECVIKHISFEALHHVKSAVSAESGALVLENCLLYSEKGDGVSIKDDTTAIMKECRIAHCGRNGISVLGGAKLTAKHCVVERCMFGISLNQKGSDVFLEECRVACCRNSGIFACHEATLKAHDLQSHKNIGRGIYLDHDAQAVVEDSSLSYNAEQGIKVDYSCELLLKCSNVIGNQRSGIDVQHKSIAILEGNKIQDNKLHGVYRDDRMTRVDLQNNIISDNDKGCLSRAFSEASIGLSKSAQAAEEFEMRRYIDTNASSITVKVHKAGEGDFRTIQRAIDLVESYLETGRIMKGYVDVWPDIYNEELIITRAIVVRKMPNQKGEVVVKSDGEMRVLRYRGPKGSYRGVIQDMTFTKSGSVNAAVKVTSGSLTLQRCTMRSEMGKGLWIGNPETKVLVEDCLVNHCGENGIYVCGEAELTARQTISRHNQHCGLYLINNARADVDTCQLTDNQTVGIGLRNGSHVTARNSSMSRNTEDGVCAIGKSSLVLEANTIEHNKGFGVDCRASAGSLHLKDNDFNDNTKGDLSPDAQRKEVNTLRAQTKENVSWTSNESDVCS